MVEEFIACRQQGKTRLVYKILTGKDLSGDD